MLWKAKAIITEAWAITNNAPHFFRLDMGEIWTSCLGVAVYAFLQSNIQVNEENV